MRICSKEGCQYPVFGTDKNTRKGYCKSHQYLRTDLGKTKNKKEAKREYGFTRQKDMFLSVWLRSSDNKGRHFCWLTGIQIDKYIDTMFESWMFAHILPKGRYPKYKLNPDNIRLLHPKVHTLVDNFTEDMRYKEHDLGSRKTHIDFNKWFELQDKLKKEYARDNN